MRHKSGRRSHHRRRTRRPAVDGAAALKGVSVLKRAERKAAKGEADERAEALAAEEAQRNEVATVEQQQQLDEWWERVIANDEEAVQ